MVAPELALQALDLVSDGVLLFDTDQLVTFANVRAETILKQSKDQLLGALLIFLGHLIG